MAGAYSTSGAGRFGDLAAGAALLGLVVLTLGIAFRWPNLIPWAVLATAAGYVSGREGRDLVDGWAAVVGVLLLLSAELASWSIEHDARVRTERALVVRRMVTLALLILSALFVNFLLLATAAVSGPSGILLAATGVVAAVLSVGIVLRLVRA